MGLIKNTLDRIKEDLDRLEVINLEISRSSTGKRRALLKNRVMIEQRVRARSQSLKEKINSPGIEAVIIADLGSGPKQYHRTFYGLNHGEVKELLEIMFSVKQMPYTLVKLQEVNTASTWEELFSEN